MKKTVFAISIGLILFAGLQGYKEQDPIIYFSNIIVLDSVYTVSPVPSAQSHNVLIEDFTGQCCSNCPTAHNTIQNLENTYPGQINAISSDSHYLFNDLCHGMVTKITGESIPETMAVKNPGQAIWLKYTYTPKNNSPHPAIVPKNCLAIAFVANNSGAQKLALQSAQAPLAL